MDFQGSNLGKNVENIRYLGNGIKQLPNFLKNLTLHLYGNDLGDNIENLKYMGDGIR